MLLKNGYSAFRSGVAPPCPPLPLPLACVSARLRCVLAPPGETSAGAIEKSGRRRSLSHGALGRPLGGRGGGNVRRVSCVSVLFAQ